MGKSIYNYKQLSQKKKAFTLIELLIVIAIIGILFIVLVSKVDFATDKAKASGVQTTFRSFQVAFETVSKENAGFNTFGWDIGDNGAGIANGDILTLNGKDYTYTNAAKDAGDRIRNSYDVGDANLNGKYDDGEVWTGRKVYTETWTGCYTLINPGNASDMSAIFDLETAINKNLDPKLHINIADDGTIYMANGYKDPWNTQYHGRYITNACTEAAAKWNTDASMNGSIGDNMDRGAIVMYSNGANQRLGTKVKIKGGIVTATVSQIDANTPDNNKMGADDYVLAVVYTYTNGLGTTSTITEGFSNNQEYLTGNGGNVGGIAYTIIDGANETFVKNSTTLSFRSNADYDKFVEVKIDNNVIDPSNYTVTEGSTIVTFTKEYFNSLGEGQHTVEIVSNDGIADASFAIQKPEPLPLPTPQLNGTIANAASPIAYEWIELKALAQSNLSASQLKNTYGIEVGDYKEVDGVKYVLVDLGNAYDGFVFMYHAGFESKFNLEYSSNGGYVGYIENDELHASEAKRVVDELYNNLVTTDEDLYSAIKQVTITCNSGKYAADGSTTYGTSVYTTTVGMFLASTQEMGFNKTDYKYSEEGVCFDLFNCEDAEIARATFIKTLSPSTSQFWLRTVVSDHYYHAYKAICLSSDIRAILNQNGVVGKYPIVPCFVIG